MVRTLATCLPLLFGFATMSTGCTSAASVCDMVCECQHCNTYAEDSTCRSLEREEARADAYECGDQYSAVLSCMVEKGTCDEERVTFTTRGPGNCAAQSTGMSCMSDADCFGGNPSCSNGMCTDSMCEGIGNPCSDDSDCDGPDLCEDEQEALQSCIEDASGKDD
jgi:hypothetical protein